MVSNNRYLEIANCRFEGPGDTAFEVAGGLQDVMIRNNRVFQYRLGFRLKEPLPSSTLFDMTLQNNTSTPSGKPGSCSTFRWMARNSSSGSTAITLPPPERSRRPPSHRHGPRL
jgi:hypothetical protein